MPNLRAVIADDEQPLLTYLKKMLTTHWPELNICGEANNGIEALELINKQKPEA